ncbi:uncharacterized protein [Chironomus tepperi]|uniref:uncharacterized protein n=1 Tax=Chironomus tepperi TaxID=113505 RepID=UPI00391EEEB4
MDPLEVLPEEVYEKIFKHLNKNDILQASLVSKYWYRVIGRSRRCMNKIAGFHVSFREMPDIKHYLESERQYQHLHLFHDFNDIKHDSKILRRLRSIVNKFAGSLVTLKSHIDIPRTSDLPKLKELEIYCSAFYQHNYCIEKLGLISRAKRLHKLTIHCSELCKHSVKAAQQNIKKIGSLKVLMIKDFYLLDGLSSENYKIEEFRLSGYSNVEWIPSYYEFFNSQQQSLKLIDCVMGFKQIAFFMENFPVLETLIVRNETFDEEEMEELMAIDALKYPLNESITTFGYFGFVFNGETDNLISIFPKLRKLQKLQLNFIDPKLTDSILDLKTVKTVEYCDIDDLFPDYRRRVEQNIRNSTCKFIRIKNF